MTNITLTKEQLTALDPCNLQARLAIWPADKDSLTAAIAFDRQGYGSIITHQMYGRTASSAFALSLARILTEGEEPAIPGMYWRADDTGIYTDTNTYAGVIPECTNISVGYFGQHGPRETLDYEYAAYVCRAVMKADFTSLTIARDPLDMSETWASTKPGKTEFDKLVDAVADHPLWAAEYLSEMGVLAEDITSGRSPQFWSDEDPDDLISWDNFSRTYETN